MCVIMQKRMCSYFITKVYVYVCVLAVVRCVRNEV
jgi:hypothetical protein